MVINRRGLLLITALIILISPWSSQLPGLIKNYRFSPNPIWLFSPIEIQKINISRSLFPKTWTGKALAVVTANKATLVLSKFLDNGFVFLDWNYYFFAGHPRERVGVKEIEKLPWWLLPLFALGLLRLPRDKGLLIKFGGWFLGVVIILNIFGLTDNLTGFILLPPIAVVIALGVPKAYEKK